MACSACRSAAWHAEHVRPVVPSGVEEIDEMCTLVWSALAWHAEHAELRVAMAVLTAGSVLAWHVAQTIAAPASVMRPLCSMVIEETWQGEHADTSAG